MRISKYIIGIISLILVLTGCGKDKEDVPVSRADTPFTSCKEFTFSVEEKSSKSRGWEGTVDDNAQFLSTVYPLDKIYLIASKKPFSWNDGYYVLELPVYELDGKQVFDICFKADGGSIWANSGENSIPVTQNGIGHQTFFSSTPVMDVSKDLCDVYTEGGVQTYEPYGDKLFKSVSNCTFVAIDGEICFSPDYRPVSEMTVTLERITNVLIPRLVICDGLETEKSDYYLEENRFTTPLGPVSDWEIRAFLAGPNNKDNGFPMEYNMISGIKESGQRGVLTVTKEYQELKSPFKHTLISVGGEVTNFTGIGYHNEDAPFIFPASEIYLYYTFHYKGNKPGIKSVNTLRFDKEPMELKKGVLSLYTTVIDIDDFIKALSDTKSKANSGVRYVNDPIFGEVCEIPYKLIKE